MSDLRYDWAHWYVEQHGWAVMLLATDSSGGKFPPRNCEPCNVNHTRPEEKEACVCLLCHGFYSATKDLERFRYMLQALPAGYLAVRTGRASGIAVLDIESRAKLNGQVPEGPYGVEVLDRWEELVGDWDLPDTLEARSVTGGLHLFYGLPSGVVVKSGPTVAPGIEVKAEGGYVAVPCGLNDRVWLNVAAPVVPAPAELLDWLPKARNIRARRAESEPVEPFGVGQRHEAIVRLAGAMRRYPEFSTEAVKAALRVVNRELCRPPHPDDVVDAKVEDVCGRYRPGAPSVAEQRAVEELVRGWLRG